MTAKNRILATLVGFITMFLLGWLLYGFLLMDFFESNTGSAMNVMRSENNMVWWALILGNILMTYLLVYIFGTWANIKSFSEGLKAGIIIGLILGFAVSMNMYGTTNLSNLTSALVDPIVSATMMGITGGVVGFMLGRK